MISKAALVSAVLLSSAASAQHADIEFRDYRYRFGKRYVSREEEVFRKSVYESRKRQIDAFNAEGHSWTQGVNQFTDLTIEELQAMAPTSRRARGNGHHSKAETTRAARALKGNQARNLQSSVDWSSVSGKVGAVSNFMASNCVGDYSMVSTYSVASLNAVENSASYVALSAQQINDCSYNDGNSGCSGGWVDYAYDYMISNVHGNGVTTAANYGWIAYDGACKSYLYSYHSSSAISGYTWVGSTDSDVMAAIADHPVSVYLAPYSTDFLSYSSGVFDGTCVNDSWDVAFLAVGYGTASPGGNYYKVLSPWGSTFGESGYVRLKRATSLEPEGKCGMLNFVLDPYY